MVHYVTQHAVDRYIERHEPHEPPAEVRRYLEWAVPHSEVLADERATGREWRRLACGAVVVTVPRAVGAAVVTVLPLVEAVVVERRVPSGRGWKWWR